MPRQEFSSVMSDILEFISASTNLDLRGSAAIEFVQSSCNENTRHSNWLDMFVMAFNSMHTAEQFDADIVLRPIFDSFLLKLIHARTNVLVKDFKDEHFSRFFTSKAGTHSELREKLKQSKSLIGLSPYAEVGELKEHLFDILVTLKLNHCERKLENGTDILTDFSLMRERQ